MPAPRQNLVTLGLCRQEPQQRAIAWHANPSISMVRLAQAVGWGRAGGGGGVVVVVDLSQACGRRTESVV